MPGKFDEMYGATKDDKKIARKPLVMNAIKRNLASAYDDAERQKIEAEADIHSAREDFKNYDINTVLDGKRVVTRCGELQVAIAEEYSDLFGEDMPNIG